jgi:Ca2+-binding RTX toxin-like protein
MNLETLPKTVNPLEKLNSNNLLEQIDRFGVVNSKNQKLNSVEQWKSNNRENFLIAKNNENSSSTNSLNSVSEEIQNYFPTKNNYISSEVKVSDFEHMVCGCFSCGSGQNNFQNNATEGNTASEKRASFSASNLKWSQPGGLGSPVNITYSYSNLLNGDIAGIDSSEVKTAMEEALNLWSSAAPLNFTEVRDSSDSQIRIGSDFIDGNSNTLAFAYFPTNGDITFDSGENWNESLFLETAVHEIGHSLGLNHESGTDAIMNPSIQNRYNGLGTSFLLQDDIDGVRSIYGRGSGSVNSLGNTSEPTPDEPTPDEPTPDNSDFIGTRGNDVLVGNNQGNLMKGFRGNDTIEGGRGADTIKGGLGADTFTFKSLDGSVDIIKDYSLAQGDRIQVSRSGFGLNSGKQFTYNATSGDLLFDDQKFAVLENKPSFDSLASGFVVTA